ncbi:MAG: hypothetical protein ACRD4R_08670 [Candidatus Acidiferrales bacterium]
MYITKNLPVAAFLVATGRMRCTRIEVDKEGRASFTFDGTEADGIAATLDFENGALTPASRIFNSYFGLKKAMFQTVRAGANNE